MILSVSSAWLSVWMFLGDVGDADIHKQHDAAMMEMGACFFFITLRDKVKMHRLQQLREYLTVDEVTSLEPLLPIQRTLLLS